MHFLWERDTKTEATSWISVYLQQEFTVPILWMWQIECFKHLEFYLLELEQEADRSLLSTVPILCTVLLQRKLQLQEEGISLSGGWEMFASSQGADFCPVVLRRHMSLCFVFHSPLSFLRGIEPMSLFFSRRELKKTVGVFWFWVSSVHTGPGNDVFQVI